MNRNLEEFWAVLPERVAHPRRVVVIEAFRWIGEPLSAIDLVDVFDGELSMGDAAHHLYVLKALGVAEPLKVGEYPESRRDDDFDVPYRLKGLHESG